MPTALRRGIMFQILVVEDDKALRELCGTGLSKNGCGYYEAKDGVEAWDVWKNTISTWSFRTS
jgi:CheY-like chemotaxis protein